MITEIDYQVLFYQTPKEYLFRLDGGGDPNWRSNVSLEFRFENILNAAPLSEYIETIIKILRDKYPNMDSFEYMLIDHETKEPMRKAKDISSIRYTHVTTPNSFAHEDNCCSGIHMVFKDAQPLLSQWIVEGLAGKTYQITQDGNSTIYTLIDSPIARVEAGGKTLNVFLDKERFMEYIIR